MESTRPSPLWRLLPLTPQQTNDTSFVKTAVSTAVTYVLSGGSPAAAAADPPHIMAPPALQRPSPHPFQLRLLHFNDLHGHLTRDGNAPLFARMVGYARARRRGAQGREAVLLLAGGDEMVGALYDFLLTDSRGAYRQHAAYQAYSAAGVTAGVIGNHDLDRGPALLAAAIRRAARFPLLAANLQLPPPLRDLVYPAAVVHVCGMRVGLIGVTTPAQLKQFPQQPVQARHPTPIVRHLAQALRPFCDVCIVLSHLGYSLQSESAQVAAAGDVELAQQLPPGSVDLIIGGHTHHALHTAAIVNGIPIVQAGMMGRYLGEALISGDGCGETVVTATHLLPTETLPIDHAFEAAQIRPLQQQAKAIVQRTLGRIEQHPDLNEQDLRRHLAAGESAFANFITDAMVQRCAWHGFRVDVAAIDGSVIHAGLPGHQLTVADWFRVMPYLDTIELVTLSGGQLAALLADNARHATAPDSGFAHFSRGLRYQITAVPASTVWQAAQATLFGRPLQMQATRTFTLALPSFFRQQRPFWAHGFSLEGLPRRGTTLFLRQELLAYIEQHQGITRAAGARRDGRLHVCSELRREGETAVAASLLHIPV